VWQTSFARACNCWILFLALCFAFPCAATDAPSRENDEIFLDDKTEKEKRQEALSALRKCTTEPLEATAECATCATDGPNQGRRSHEQMKKLADRVRSQEEIDSEVEAMLKINEQLSHALYLLSEASYISAQARLGSKSKQDCKIERLPGTESSVLDMDVNGLCGGIIDAQERLTLNTGCPSALDTERSAANNLLYQLAVGAKEKEVFLDSANANPKLNANLLSARKIVKSIDEYQSQFTKRLLKAPTLSESPTWKRKVRESSSGKPSFISAADQKQIEIENLQYREKLRQKFKAQAQAAVQTRQSWQRDKGKPLANKSAAYVKGLDSLKKMMNDFPVPFSVAFNQADLKGPLCRVLKNNPSVFPSEKIEEWMKLFKKVEPALAATAVGALAIPGGKFVAGPLSAMLLAANASDSLLNVQSAQNALERKNEIYTLIGPSPMFMALASTYDVQDSDSAAKVSLNKIIADQLLSMGLPKFGKALAGAEFIDPKVNTDKNPPAARRPTWSQVQSHMACHDLSSHQHSLPDDAQTELPKEYREAIQQQYEGLVTPEDHAENWKHHSLELWEAYRKAQPARTAARQ
jgi:hypothetical protein